MPAARVHPLAIEAMREVGIDISRQYPKSITEFDLSEFDAVVSLCEADTDTLCPATFVGVREQWKIPDPVGLPMEAFRQVRDTIGERVKALVNRLLMEDDGC
jgi:arsenate reductase